MPPAHSAGRVMTGGNDARKPPSFRQIAEKLREALSQNTYDWENEQECDGVLTLTYGKFSALTGRALLTKRLYSEVELEAARIGLVVAFGQHAVIVADDSDFATNGLPTLDAKYARAPREGRTVKPKMTDDEKRSLFARIGRNKRRASS